MNAREIITKFKDWLQQKKGTNLNLDACEAEILEYSLEGKSYKQMKIPNYESSTITNIKGPKLFKRLGEITGIDVNKKNCRLVLIRLLEQNNEQVIKRTTNYLSNINLIEAPNISDFYGREQQLSDLQKWIVTERCRVVGVLGISGIGKTAIVRELVEKVQEDFDYVIWKSLEFSPSLTEILIDIERYFPYSNPETSIDQRIFNLINFLNQHRCLLILDQWEGVMESGETSENQQKINFYYENFLRRFGESEHQSCLVFTCLQRPRVMDLLGNRKNIKQLPLTGLENQDARTLLTELELVDPGIDKLIEIYQGHPLALILASESIKNIHNYQINQFMEGTVYIPNAMLIILDKMFSYLSNLEINIMQNLATETEPKLISQIYQFFPSKSQTEISESVNKLWLIRLIEKEDIQESRILWILNPLIKKYLKRRYSQF